MREHEEVADAGFAWLMSITDPNERAQAARYSGYAYADEHPHPRFTQGRGAHASLNAAAYGTRLPRPEKTRQSKGRER